MGFFSLRHLLLLVQMLASAHCEPYELLKMNTHHHVASKRRPSHQMASQYQFSGRRISLFSANFLQNYNLPLCYVFLGVFVKDIFPQVQKL